LFLISPSACFEIASCTLSKVFFRSRQRGWRWNRRHPSDEVRKRHGGAV
jgi:hypothetical protein